MIEPEEIFPDSSFSPGGDVSYEREKKLEVPVASRLLTVLQLLMLSTFLCLFLYILYLNVWQEDIYRDLAQQNTQRIFYTPAARGEIFDSKGNVLATSVSAFDVELRIRELPKREEDLEILIRSLAYEEEAVEQIRSRITDAKTKNLDRILVLAKLSSDDVARLQKQISQISGVVFRERPMRVYPYKQYTAHVTGYTGSASVEDLRVRRDYRAGDEIGKAGLELFYEDSLRGTSGSATLFVNSTGEVLGERVISPSQKGIDLRTTLDLDLQRISFDALTSALQEKGLGRGSVVALDPRDGSIRALVSLPSYDPNNFARGLTIQEYSKLLADRDKPLFNRAIGGTYPSGSIIKPIIAVAALQEGIISPSKYLYTAGSISVPSKYDPSVVYTFLDWKNHGAVNMREAIAVSSNVYFYMIGGGYEGQEGLGIQRIKEYLSLFGWGEKRGIDLPGEQNGFIPSPQWKYETKKEEWYIGDTYHISIGQGDVLATPLQIAVSIASFANGGKLPVPHIIESIGTDMQRVEGRNLNLSPGIIQVVQDGMRQAVMSGSSQLLKALPVHVAGKTGTAQTGKETTHAWFVGFAPYEDPELLLVVMMEEGGESTGATAVAYEIFKQYYKSDSN